MMQLESKQDLDQMEYNPDVTDATREFKLKVNDGSLIAKASSFTRSAYENLVKEPMTAFLIWCPSRNHRCCLLAWFGFE